MAPVPPAARILVLADDLLVQAGLGSLLTSDAAESMGFQLVGSATFGPEAEEALTDGQPDVVLVDLGWEADGAGRRIDELELPVPWVALVPDAAAGAAAWQSGAGAVLARTADAKQLVAALGAVLAGLEAAAPGLRRAVTSSESPPLWTGEGLTPRELEVLALLADGLANKAIGRQLGISDHTVKFHVNAVLGKLGAQSRTEAAMRAARLGLVRL